MSVTSVVRSGCLVLVIGTFAIVGFMALTAMNSPQSADAPAQPAVVSAQAHDAEDPAADPAADPACTQAAQLAVGSGLLTKGSIDRNGIVLLTDVRWTRLDGDNQELLMKCVAQEIAGGQGKTLKRLVVKNQRTGVTYATLDFGRFRIGE